MVLRVRTGSAGETRWETAERPLPPDLAGLVGRRTGFGERAPWPVVREEVPTTETVLVLPLDAATSARRGVDVVFGPLLVGPGGGPTVTGHPGRQRGVEVRLAPLAARRLLRLPAHECAGRVLDLDACWPRAARAAEAVAGAGTWDEALDVVDGLLRSVAVAGGEGPDEGTTLAWDLLVRRRGDVRVAELEEVTGWSRRRLGQRLREHVGLTPKRAARLLRVEHAAELLRGRLPGTLVGVALACGFYDQAHLHREFLAHAGTTPGRFRARWGGDPAGTAMAAAPGALG